MMNYEKEIRELKLLLQSPKNIIINTSYEIEQDLNIQDFLKKFPKTVENGFDLDIGKDRVLFGRFMDDLKTVITLIDLMIKIMYKNMSDKDADSIEKCCNAFPDNIGKRILSQLSYFYYLSAVYDYYKIYQSTQREICYVCKKIYEEELEESFSPSLDIENYKDLTLQEKHKKKTIQYFEEHKKEMLDKINYFNIYFEDISEARLIETGKIIWNNYSNNKKKDSEKMKESFKKILNALS